MSSIIEVNNLVKEYGRKRALDNVSFTLNAGSPLRLLAQMVRVKPPFLAHFAGI